MIAGTAFAETSFSAWGAVKGTLIQGYTGDDIPEDHWWQPPVVGFDGAYWGLTVGTVNDDNTAGAKFSLEGDGGKGWFYGWWRPAEWIYLKMGNIGEDGNWAGAGIVCWDLHSNELLMHPGFDWYNGFAGSILSSGIGYFDGGDMQFQLSLYPVDGLSINTGFLMGGDPQENYFDNLRLQVVYSIPGAGTAAIGFVNAPGEDDDKNAKTKNLYAQYGQSFGDLNVQLGLNFGFGKKAGGIDVKDPINIGLGIGYGSPWGSQFWVNARVGAEIGMEDKSDNKIGFDVVPSYDIGIFRVYVPVGLAMVLPDVGDTILAWNFSPYIRKGLGNLDFYIGFMLFNGIPAPHPDNAWSSGGSIVPTKASGENVNWSIPFGIHWVW